MNWMTWILVAASTIARTLPKPTPAELQRTAVALQRAAIRKQAESLGLWMQPGSPAPAPAMGPASEPPACETMADAVVAPLIESAARAQSLDTRLIRAVIERESGFHACAVSSRGAQGLMQLMPETAGLLGVRDSFDPKENIEAGARYLKQLLDKYQGDLAQALSAYNAGPAVVDQTGGAPEIPETKDYVNAILEKLGLARDGQPIGSSAKPAGN
jgi:soluble lytic murein transglycosylase-like protein